RHQRHELPVAAVAHLRQIVVSVIAAHSVWRKFGAQVHARFRQRIYEVDALGDQERRIIAAKRPLAYHDVVDPRRCGSRYRFRKRFHYCETACISLTELSASYERIPLDKRTSGGAPMRISGQDFFFRGAFSSYGALRRQARQASQGRRTPSRQQGGHVGPRAPRQRILDNLTKRSESVCAMI